ncbi:MAG: TetR/AcrR family transcriptional regulator [Pseudobutyrivibrio sp.]|nr:TetR/AcrR family transcriptional regulator [Pseudobutyrivibrio sp.]
MRERSKDLRVRRTITGIRKSFFELVLEKNYNEISITELTDRAGINRKTFYLHYSSLDDLVSEVEEEIVEEILEAIGESAENFDLKGCITNFYKYLETRNAVQQRLLCDDHYSFFYESVTDAVLKSKPFVKFFEVAAYPTIVRSYTICITFIYRDWLRSGKKIPFDELAAQACQIIENGYNGITKKK